MSRLDANDLEVLRRVSGYLYVLKDPPSYTVLAGKLSAICESAPGDREAAVKSLVIEDAGVLENAARPAGPHTADFRDAAVIVKTLLGAPPHPI